MSDTEGLVIKNTGSWYTVLTDGGNTIDCKIKGNFRLKGIRSTNPVAVGDRVEIVRNHEGTAFITNICDRRNYIIRKSSNLSKQSHIIAANVDQAFLIVTVKYPETSTTFIDRFLASAEAYSVPVTLVFNKVDLLQDDEILKGTNSLDKLNGSRMFLEAIVKLPVSGIIATHDLELSKMADEYPARFHNFCFEIKLSDAITYTYKISPGVARNQNATYLLKGILKEE